MSLELARAVAGLQKHYPWEGNCSMHQCEEGTAGLLRKVARQVGAGAERQYSKLSVCHIVHLITDTF